MKTRDFDKLKMEGAKRVLVFMMVSTLFGCANQSGTFKETANAVEVGIPVTGTIEVVPEYFHEELPSGDIQRHCTNCPIEFGAIKNLIVQMPTDKNSAHGFRKPANLSEASELLEKSIPSEFLNRYFSVWKRDGFMVDSDELNYIAMFSVADFYTDVWFYGGNEALLNDMQSRCTELLFGYKIKPWAFDLALLKLFSEKYPELTKSRKLSREELADPHNMPQWYENVCQ